MRSSTGPAAALILASLQTANPVPTPPEATGQGPPEGTSEHELTDRVETPERGIRGEAAAQSAPRKAHTSKDFTWGLLAILALVGIGIVLTRAFRNSAQPVTATCPAGTTGAARARLLGALSCAKQAGNGTLTFTEGGRSIVMTYQEPASLMTVDSQPGAAGPGPIRVIQIGTNNWQSQGTGRWDHFIDDPKDFLDSLAAQVRQAATIDQTGSTFSVPPSGPDNASFGGDGQPAQITLTANGSLEALSGTSVNSDGSSVAFRAVFSQMGSTPPITAPPSDQVDDSRPGGEPLPPGVRAPPTPPVSTPGHPASTP
jgi:hypothetical protein